MKVLFFSASSSYVHTLLAPRYLAENSSVPIYIHETNVNVPLEKNIEFINDFNPDVIAFSCYIFNISYVEKILDELLISRPDTITVLGGYEASFNAEKLIKKCSFIIKGEGDFSFGKLLCDIRDKKVCAPQIYESGTVKDLDLIKSPYTDGYCKLSLNHHILYMETCRGCPFGCSYCMSANTHGVRSFSLERIYSDFEKISKYNPPLVKLVDRTFNYDKKRAGNIFSFLIDKFKNSNTRFHFEMAPELFDEELFGILETAPKGLFQFEIGVQSYKKETLEKVKRRADCNKIDANLSRLVKMGNIPIHVDLIAGLPCESKDDFIKGFDRLISVKPDCLQAGFLKILPGSEIADNCDGYVIENTPPYEIVSSPQMTEEDLKELKKAEKILNIYYNSGRFKKSMDFILQKISPYSFFLSLALFYEKNDVKKVTLSAKKQSDLLYEYCALIFSQSDLSETEKRIYEDFIDSGNVRKWHKWIGNS